MGSIDKLIRKLQSVPADFKYSELKRVLEAFGYTEDAGGKTSGSYVCFKHSEFAPISLHKPHPGDEVKKYTINYVIKLLKEREQI